MTHYIAAQWNAAMHCQLSMHHMHIWIAWRSALRQTMSALQKSQQSQRLDQKDYRYENINQRKIGKHNG